MQTAEKSKRKENLTDLLVSPNINLLYLKEFNPETPSMAENQSNSKLVLNTRDYQDHIAERKA